MDSNVLTLVSIFLPLSSIWASSSVDGLAQSPPGSENHRKVFGSYASGSTGLNTDHKATNGPLSPSSSAYGQIGNSSIANPKTSRYQDTHADLEAQDLAAVRVERTFSVARRNGIL